MSSKATRNERLALRREAKFDKHNISIIDQGVTEERGQGDFAHDVQFNYAILRGKQLVGRATTRRHALKRAHQACKV